MKKSFTLKAFAFGAIAALGLSANAAAPQAVRFNNETVNPATLQASKDAAEVSNCGLRINPQLVKASRENAMKVAAHRVEPSWGEWTDGGEMQVSDWINDNQNVKTVTYQIRQDNANEGNFQVKVSEFFKYSNTTGCSPVISVEADPANPGEYIAFCEGTYVLGWNDVNVGLANTWNMSWTDHYTWLNYIKSKGASVSDDVIASWKDVSYYLPDEGKIMIQGVYFDTNPQADQITYCLGGAIKDANGNTIGYEYDHFFRKGAEFKNYDYTLGYAEGYFSHEKNATTGTFTMPIELNDNGDLYIGIFKSLTATTAKNYVQQIVNVMHGTEGATLPQDIIKVTKKDGNIELPMTLNNPYTAGTKKLLYVLDYKDGYYRSNYNTKNGLTNLTVQLTAEDVEYYAAGEAEYKDATMYDILPGIFGYDSYEEFQEDVYDQYEDEFPDEYIVTRPLQASSVTEGKYRIFRPYQEYYNNYLSNYLYYEPALDYLYFTVDGTDVTVLQNTNGFYYKNTAGDVVAQNYGSVNQYSNSVFTASDNCFGELEGNTENGKITFPEPVFDGYGQAAANVVAPLGWSVGAYDTASGIATPATACDLVYESGESYIAFGSYAGVNTVAADKIDNANAPVEYFNLQGMRVLTPAAGQLLIRRQGTNVEKVVIR